MSRDISLILREKKMVGTTEIEPATPAMSTKCSPAELRPLSKINS